MSGEGLESSVLLEIRNIHHVNICNCISAVLNQGIYTT